jgi:hypothetical protein
MLTMQLFQPLFRDMGINLCGGQIGVAKQQLHNT